MPGCHRTVAFMGEGEKGGDEGKSAGWGVLLWFRRPAVKPFDANATARASTPHSLLTLDSRRRGEAGHDSWYTWWVQLRVIGLECFLYTGYEGPTPFLVSDGNETRDLQSIKQLL